MDSGLMRRFLDSASRVSVSLDEAESMKQDEIRELVVGSEAARMPTIRTIRLAPESGLHEHTRSLTLLRVLVGKARVVTYKTHPRHWSRYMGGLMESVSGRDISAGFQVLLSPDALSVHQLLSLEEPTVVLEAHWPPLTHSIHYTLHDEVGLIMPAAEWFSHPERRRRFPEGEDA